MSEFMDSADNDTIRMHCRMMEEHSNAIRALLKDDRLGRLIDALESLPSEIEVVIRERK